MRPIQSVLMSLLVTTVSIGAAAAQNVCVRAADGAIVCGPVANRSGASPSPWTQSPRPDDNAKPGDRPAAERAPAPRDPPRRAIRRAERDLPPPPPKHVHRQPPPRELERHPPRRIAREDERRRQVEQDRRPPPRVVRVERNVMARQYDARLRELEREVRALRADRDVALRRIDRRPPPWPPYREHDTRRLERERDAALRRVSHKQANRERTSND